MFRTSVVSVVFASAVLLCSSPVLATPCTPEPGAICAGGISISEAQMMTRLRDADLVIIGEQHDNPAHHEKQANIIAALEPNGLGFEMVPRAKETALYQARITGEDAGAALDWANSGWPEWSLYKPLFDAAPGAVVTGGDLGRDATSLAVTSGAATAFGSGAARYGLDRPLPEETLALMTEEQKNAHCGALPAEMLPGMVEAQRLRDAAFADAALRLVEEGFTPAILITGNGHARTDRGSPLYLKQAAPALKVISIGQIEVREGESDNAAPFDIVIYSAPFDRGDPCEALIRKIRSKKKPALPSG